MSESHPSGIILRAREMQKNGDFDRRIINRVPQSLELDTTVLECGHTGFHFVRMSPEETTYCNDCAEEWMKREAEKQQ